MRSFFHKAQEERAVERKERARKPARPFITTKSKPKKKARRSIKKRYPDAYYIVNRNTGKVVDGPFSVAEGDSVVDARGAASDQLIQGGWLTDLAFQPDERATHNPAHNPPAAKRGAYAMTQREQQAFTVLMYRTTYSDAVKDTAKIDKRTKAARKKELQEAGVVCQAERKEAREKVSATCAKRRTAVRKKARATLDKTKARRKATRKTWVETSRRFRGGVPLKIGERKYTRKESDQIALQGLDKAQHKFFMQTRKDWDYDRQPDARAEMFREYVQTDEGTNAFIEWQMANLPTDIAYARAYAKHAAEDKELEELRELEAAPF